MDLNDLHQRRGVSAYLARHAWSQASREAQGAFARVYPARFDPSRGDQWDDAA